jgi:hypothetical protein
MADPKSKVHEITIKVHTNRAITVDQAQFAAWSCLQHQPIFGSGDHREPWTHGHITVRKCSPKTERASQ